MLDRVRSIEVDHGFTGGSSLSRNHDYTIGPPGTINRGSRGIFQDFNRSDVFGRWHRSTYKSIHHENRITIRIDRSPSTDPYFQISSRCAIVGLNLQPGNPALNGLDPTYGWICSNIFSFYRRNSPGQIAFFDQTISHDDHFIQ